MIGKMRIAAFSIAFFSVPVLYGGGSVPLKTLFWHGSPHEKKIALTFDDGPNEPYTSEILKILKDNNVHATFFMVGKNVEMYPDAARAIVAEGHAIGNHTYDHRTLLRKTMQQVETEIVKAGEAIFFS